MRSVGSGSRNRFPQTKALVLSSHDEREYINQAIMAGEKGYLLKGTSTKDLVNSIRYIHQGYFQLGSGLLDKISLSASETSRSLVDSLSRYDLDSQQLSHLESKLTKLFVILTVYPNSLKGIRD